MAEVTGFSDEKLAKEILPSKIWKCHMEDNKFGNFETLWAFTHIKGNRLKVKVEFSQHQTCRTESMKVKVKKNALKFFESYSTPCYSFGGSLKYYRDESDKIKAKGNYKIWQFLPQQFQCE